MAPTLHSCAGIAADAVTCCLQATMTQALGLSCTNTSGIGSCVVAPASLPNVIDAKAMLSILAGAFVFVWCDWRARAMAADAQQQLPGVLPPTRAVQSPMPTAATMNTTVRPMNERVFFFCHHLRSLDGALADICIAWSAMCHPLPS